jgi:hypothetical protein
VVAVGASSLTTGRLGSTRGDRVRSRAAIRSKLGARTSPGSSRAGSSKAFSSRAGSSKVGSSLGRQVRAGRPGRVASARARCRCSSAAVWSASY